MSQQIRCLEGTRIPIHRDTRSYRKIKWLGPLNRLLEWAWEKVSKEYTFSKIEYKTVTINTGDIMRDVELAILRHKQEFSSKPIKYILVGALQYQDLANKLTEVECFDIYSNPGVSCGEPFTLNSATVHLVPWFDGVLLLPELK